MTTEQKNNQPQLSILIASIPGRAEKAQRLYNDVMDMVGDKNIEVIFLMDNCKRSIGAKREALKNISNGKYFMLLDDDDALLTIEELYAATFDDVDVITFKQRCFNSDKTEYIVTFGLGYEVNHPTNGKGMYVDMNRPPFHVCAWSSHFKNISFGDKNFGEDWDFVEQAIKKANIEKHLDVIVHQYNFDPKISTVSGDMEEQSKAIGIYTKMGYPNKEFYLQALRNEVGEKPAGYWPMTDSLTLESKNNSERYAIVNLITADVPRYATGQNRLQESMAKHAPVNVDSFFFVGEESVNAPSHADNPYAFKLYAIDYVRKQGYRKILWLDASVVAVRDFTSIFDRIEKNGIFFEDSGWKVGQWINNEALSIFNITREEAMKMPMFSAGFVGFDFTNPVACQFFARWWSAMLQGTFKGSWENHRHDMSAGSVVSSQMNLTHLYAKTTEFFSYIGDGYTPNPDSPFQLLGL